MDLVTQSILMMFAGVVCLLVFVYLLFVVSPRWFPRSNPARVPPAMAPSAPLPFGLLGGLEFVLLIGGIFLTVSGFFMVQLR